MDINHIKLGMIVLIRASLSFKGAPSYGNKARVVRRSFKKKQVLLDFGTARVWMNAARVNNTLPRQEWP